MDESTYGRTMDFSILLNWSDQQASYSAGGRPIATLDLETHYIHNNSNNTDDWDERALG